MYADLEIQESTTLRRTALLAKHKHHSHLRLHKEKIYIQLETASYILYR